MPRRAGPRAGRPLPFRIGLGYDRHPCDPSRPLVLGGARLPTGPGLAGHSDADALLHAVCDALLGALGRPELGRRFPSDDPGLKDAPSRTFVEHALGEVRAAGYALANADLVLVAELPRLAPHVEAIRAALARTLGLPAERVGFKVKSGEGLGWVGRGEGMEAQAVVLLSRAPRPARKRVRR